MMIGEPLFTPGSKSHDSRRRALRSVSRRRFLASTACVCLFVASLFLLTVPVAASSPASPSPLPEQADPYAGLGISLSSSAAIVVETGRGMELYSSQPGISVYIPAVSKIMTAMLVLEKFPVSTLVTISLTAEEANLSSAEDNRIDNFTAGAKFTVEFLITSMMYLDSDAAAIALAEQVSGDERAFVALMNDRAEQLKLTSTFFLNSTGRPVSGDPTGADGQQENALPLTTPRDAMLLARFFLYKESFAGIVRTAFESTSYSFFPPGTATRSIEITNNLAHAKWLVTGLTGVFSSGDSESASLIAAYSAGGFEILVILAGGDPGSRITDLQTVGKQIFDNYTNTLLVSAGQPVPETIKDSVEGKVFGLVYKRTVNYVKRIGETGVIDREYTSSGPHNLPLMADDTVGTMTFTFENGTSISVECAPNRTIYSVDSSMMDRILTAFESNRDVYAIILICAGFLCLSLLYQMVVRSVRLYWRLRLRRAEKAAGTTLGETSTKRDAGGGRRE